VVPSLRWSYNRTFRKRDLRVAVSAGFRDEDAVPVRSADGDVVDIEDQVREALIKNAWLDGEGNLGSD